MYNVDSTLVLKRAIGAQWENVNLDNSNLFTIYNDYKKVYLITSNVFLSGPQYIDLDDLRDLFKDYNLSLKVALQNLGNLTLPTVPSLPNNRIRYTSYSDAFRAGYKVETTLAGKATPLNFLPSDLVDLKLSRPNTATDLRAIHTHCLVSVNGFIHRTDTDGQFAYVYDGRKSLTKSRINTLGIISFLDIGSIQQVRIRPEDIYAQSLSSDLKTRTYFHVDQDLTNKSVILILGGYIVMPEDGIFWQTGDRTLALNITSLPIIERIFESKKYLDISSLGLTENSFNTDIINVQEFLSDAVLRNYLTMSQSFLAVIDTPNIFSNKHFLSQNNLPGMFVSYKEPKQPLIVGYGKIADYWKTEEDTQWSVTVEDSFTRNHVFSTRPVNQLQNVTSANIPGFTFKHSPGFLLEIGSYK